MKLIYKIIALSLCVSILFLFSCKTQFYTINAVRFNSDVYVAVNSKIDKGLETELLNTLSKVDNDVSITNKDSTLYAFNNSNKDEKVNFLGHAKTLLDYSKECFDKTNGKFNPCIYPLLTLWQLSPETFNKGEFTIPSKSQIDALLPLTNFNKVKVENDLVYKTEDGVCLDFGGIAKGYAVDLLKDGLAKINPTEGYINIGGSSLFIYKVDSLSIRHPDNENDIILKLSGDVLKTRSVSTSGDYEKYYDYNEKRYSHILDVSTGAPVDTDCSAVTIISKNAYVGDAISTAIMQVKSQDLKSYIELLSANFKDENLKIFAVYKSEKTIYTNEKQGNFTLLDDSFNCKFI